MSTRTVLYVEDEEDYQLLLRRILEPEGYCVRTVDTGQDGLIALEQERPDLLILDINLPDTNGYDLCTQLRRQAAWMDLPILMLTVRRRPAEWLRGFSCGADDYLAKPINPPDLLERVARCFEGRTEAPANASAEYQLIQAARNGNRSAFEVLIEQHRLRLRQNLAPHLRSPSDADDIMARSFSLAFQHLDRFRGESSFYTWLCRIALNESHHLYRRTSPLSLDTFLMDEDGGTPASLVEEDSAETLANREVFSKAGALLRQLPEPYREMLHDHVLNGVSYETLAKKWDVPIGTVMSRLYKARQLFQERWKAQAFSDILP